MRMITTRLVASMMVVLAVGTASAEPQSLRSGKYESLLVAVDSTGGFEGYFSEQSGEMFKCSFYLKGSSVTGEATTWSSASMPGTIRMIDDGVILAIPEGRDHPGCPNVLIPEIATGVEYTKTHATAWVSLVTVKSDKALLMASPDANAKHKAYVVKGDVVGVIEFKEGWAQVEFINDNDHSYKGWIRTEQYRAIQPPL